MVSPRREPWGTMWPCQKPRQGRQSCVQEDFLSPLRGSDSQYPNPRLTPWATLSPLLRSYQKWICAQAAPDCEAHLSLSSG